MRLSVLVLLTLAAISSVSGQMRRVVRKYSGDRKGGGFKRLKKVKIPSGHSSVEAEADAHEAASERLLNPFSLFNLVRFPNTQCTTNRGQSLYIPTFMSDRMITQESRVSATPPLSVGAGEASQPGAARVGSARAASSRATATPRPVRTGRCSPPRT